MLRPSLPAAALALAAGIAAAEPVVSVEKTAGCGCCRAWVEHMRDNGWTVEATDVAAAELVQTKIARGVTAEHASCHTATVDGYVIEGHVPADDVARLIAERPDALGLAVPGMPFGSPGMEVPGREDPYEVLLLLRDGSAEVFSRHE